MEEKVNLEQSIYERWLCVFILTAKTTPTERGFSSQNKRQVKAERQGTRNVALNCLSNFPCYT